MFKDLKKILKFICVGISNTTISLIIYYFLKFIGINYLVSMGIGYIISSITGYVLNKLWVFKNKEEKQKSIYRYYALYVSALIFNLLLTYFQVEVLGISDNISPLVTTAAITIYNYIFSNLWVFNPDFKIDKKLILKNLKDNKFYYCSLFIVIIGLIFLFINNIYNHPVADDYSNYNSLVSFTSDNSIDSIKEYAVCSIKRTIDIYKTWQGTYFSNIFFSLNPLLISLNFYKFIVFIIQLIWVASNVFLFSSIPNKTKNKKTYGMLSMFLIIFPILSFYSLGEGFYWYTGVVLYLLPYSLSLILLGLIARFINKKNNLLLMIMIIMTILLAGTSYVTGLFVGFILACITLYMYAYKNENKKIFLMLTIIFSISFLFNVCCPGNFNRVTETEEVSMIDIILISIANSYEMIKHLLFETLFIPFLIIIVPSLKQVSKEIKIKYVNPMIPILLCAICFVCLFMPMAFSYKNFYQEPRVKNIQLLYLAIMVILNIVNYYGYMTKGNIKKTNYDKYAITGVVVAIIMISAIGTERISGFVLIDDILYKNSSKYDLCMDEMEGILSNKTKDKVIIETCEVYPKSLHHYKMESDGWINEAMSTYYKKIIEVINYEG